METKLQGIPRWHLRSAVQHKDIRLIEQASFKKALLADRAVWLIVDWGLGKEGFLFSTLHTEEDQHVEVFRLNCEEVSSVETLTSETQKQFQLTFQELCLYLSALPSSYLILDNLPEPTTTLQTEGWFDCLDEIVQAAVDLASTIRIVLTSRRVPTTSKFNMVHIRPLEEPECARYIAAHPEGGPDLLGMRGVERLYAKSQGIPMHLDRMLTELHTISIDELSILEQEGTIETPQIEPVPRALVQAISILQHSTDKYTGRSLRLLKVLTILSQGETLESVRKFDPIEPLYPQNAEELRTLGLIEAIPLVTPGLQLGQHNTVARIDAASPKLLIVPRQVRDYVHSVITEEEHHSIVERSLEIYFGPQWREGKISLLPASKLRVREGIAGGPGNPYIVTLLMLRTALTRGDEVLFLQVFRLVDSYLTALNEADRFRDMYTISQEVFHLLESTGKKPEVAKVAYRYGYSLRMLGHHEESIRILEKALEYAPPQFGEEWQASVYLSLALAHVSCKDEDMAIAAAKAVQERTVADSAQAYQAQSVLLKCMAGEDWAPNTFAKLADLEQKARRKGYLVVANNIALDLAQQTDNTAERNRLRARVLQTKEDVYNRIRATIAKAEELAKAGRQNDVTVQERRFLNEAYSYLYLQRLGNLFERCHDDLWQIASTEVGSPLLLRLFRFSSFLWRVFGKTTRERQYLRQLKHVCDPGTVRSLERDREEVSYYLTRLRVLDE